MTLAAASGAVSRYRVACSGWSYDDWVGPFYPRGAAAGEFLERYARVFDTVEVDSTFYHAPRREHVARWAAVTPPGFRFLVKVPGAVTHEARLAGADAALREFLAALAPLRERTAALLVQMPESFRAEGEHPARLESFLASAPREWRWAVELRHASWWRGETFRALESARAALVWNVHPSATPPPVLTADFAYVRFIGDRALDRFDRIQRDLRGEVEAMRARLEAEGLPAREVFVVVNNHFMGFGPGTAQIVQDVFGLPRADLARASRDGGQRGLGEFAP